VGALINFFSYINPASYIENDNFVNDDFDSVSDDLNYDDSISLNKPPSYTRVSRIDNSPEAEKKRKEAYEKWLKSVNVRERERKRLQREREEAMIAKRLEEEESKRAANDEKVKEWMKKKELEAQKKLTRLNELKTRSCSSEIDLCRKTKDFKKAIDFKQWLEKKNDEHKVQKRNEEERKKLQKDYRVCRESTSAALYSKWKESSKKTPKPVPMNRGLDSLRGSTTKIFVNPIAWKSLDD
jgi:coiled-coil domain-containing protein 34